MKKLPLNQLIDENGHPIGQLFINEETVNE